MLRGRSGRGRGVNVVLLEESAGGGPGFVLIDRTAGTNIGTMVLQGGLAASFDGNTSQTGATSSGVTGVTNSYVGKTLAAARVFGKATVHGPNNTGYLATTNNSVTINIRGKDGAAPSNSTDGTIIGTITFTDTANESTGRDISSTDLVNNWDHIFAHINSAGTEDHRMTELILYAWE